MAFRQRTLQVSCPHLLTPGYFAVVASCLFSLASCIWSQRLTLPASFDILPRLRAANVLVPPMLLNHVLVGVLLLPLGWLILYAARHSAARVAWAQVVVRTTAVTVATLPVILLALMGFRYFDAPLFVLGAALVTAAAVALLFAAFSRVT